MRATHARATPPPPPPPARSPTDPVPAMPPRRPVASPSPPPPRPARYVFCSGLLASWTVLFIKCAGEIVKGRSRAPSGTIVSEPINPLADGRTYALLVGLVVSLPLQLMYLNRALQRFEAQFVVPSLQAFWALSSISKGGLFFDEFDKYTGRDSALFVVGVLVSLVGVFLLSMRRTVAGSAPPSPSAQHTRTSEPSPMPMRNVDVAATYPSAPPPAMSADLTAAATHSSPPHAVHVARLDASTTSAPAAEPQAGKAAHAQVQMGA